MTTRRIMCFSVFKEALTVGLQDNPAMKMAKQAANQGEKFLGDYKKFKDRLTQVYTSINPKDGKPIFNDEALKAEVERILGKEDPNKIGSRNPYLQELITVLDLERQMKKLEDREGDDKLAEEDLRQQISDEQDPNTKKEIQTRIDKLKERIGEAGTDVNKIATDLATRKKEFETKMTKTLGELKKSIGRIKDQSRK